MEIEGAETAFLTYHLRGPRHLFIEDNLSEGFIRDYELELMHLGD